MNEPEVMQKFADVEAIVSNGHFVYTSGRHSSVCARRRLRGPDSRLIEIGSQAARNLASGDLE